MSHESAHFRKKTRYHLIWMKKHTTFGKHLSSEFLHRMYRCNERLAVSGIKGLLLDLVVVEFICPSGARSALSMELTLGAMVDNLWSSIYRLKTLHISDAFFFPERKFSLYYLMIFFGCVASAPSESSPRGYDWLIAADYRLKTLFFGFKIELKALSPRIMTSLMTKMINCRVPWQRCLSDVSYDKQACREMSRLILSHPIESNPL
jgi:hypothetical protein